MDFIDFLIGLTLVNILPHFTLGIWKGRILSAFGFGDKQNIAYGILNFVISISLFHFKYGIESFFENGMYAGGMFVVVSYFVLGHFLYKTWHFNYYK
jgi:hypothetical protein